SGRWYPHDQGLSKDIEVVKLVHDAFKDKNVDILVDSNDMYNYQDTIDFLAGIGDIPIFWVEEPFAEDMENGQLLRKWMDNNGFSKTLYADGEANPDHDLCLEMANKDILDVYLPDVHGYGFTNWIKLMPELTKRKCLASPHAWGNMLKTHYISHLAAGLGNIVTIEGVTCVSDEIDFGDYKIINGKLRVSEDPGFGMKLL
ncbi:MAG: mandelate racemase/muconate lactonizing protein, partial [Cyclobacteriaceae bacterium]|nr:mandelate racemase/muconate lactonizing protein [Cyclobacteriaceae bacterium]